MAAEISHSNPLPASQQQVYEQLLGMFPNHSPQYIRKVVSDSGNAKRPLDPELLHHCLNELLESRTEHETVQDDDSDSQDLLITGTKQAFTVQLLDSDDDVDLMDAVETVDSASAGKGPDTTHTLEHSSKVEKGNIGQQAPNPSTALYSGLSSPKNVPKPSTTPYSGLPSPKTLSNPSTNSGLPSPKTLPNPSTSLYSGLPPSPKIFPNPSSSFKALDSEAMPVIASPKRRKRYFSSPAKKPPPSLTVPPSGLLQHDRFPTRHQAAGEHPPFQCSAVSSVSQGFGKATMTLSSPHHTALRQGKSAPCATQSTFSSECQGSRDLGLASKALQSIVSQNYGKQAQPLAVSSRQPIKPPTRVEGRSGIHVPMPSFQQNPIIAPGKLIRGSIGSSQQPTVSGQQPWCPVRLNLPAASSAGKIPSLMHVTVTSTGTLSSGVGSLQAPTVLREPVWGRPDRGTPTVSCTATSNATTSAPAILFPTFTPVGSSNNVVSCAGQPPGQSAGTQKGSCLDTNLTIETSDVKITFGSRNQSTEPQENVRPGPSGIQVLVKDRQPTWTGTQLPQPGDRVPGARGDSIQPVPTNSVLPGGNSGRVLVPSPSSSPSTRNMGGPPMWPASLGGQGLNTVEDRRLGTGVTVVPSNAGKAVRTRSVSATDPRMMRESDFRGTAGNHGNQAAVNGGTLVPNNAGEPASFVPRPLLAGKDQGSVKIIHVTPPRAIDVTQHPVASGSRIEQPAVIDVDRLPPMPRMQTDNELWQAAKTEVLVLFPDVDPAHLDGLRNSFPYLSDPMLVNTICNSLLETNYPKKKVEVTTNASSTKASSTVTSKAQVEEQVDYYKNYKSVEIPVSNLNCYANQTITNLRNEFRWISIYDLNLVMKKFDGHFAPAHRAISQIWLDVMLKKEQADKDGKPFVLSGMKLEPVIKTDDGEFQLKMNLLKNQRGKRETVHQVLDELLQKELHFISRKRKENSEEADWKLAMEMNEQMYEELGQLIECGCCFGEYPFDSLVQCYDGHLFCTSCLQQYAQESVFGQGKASLVCMTDGCDCAFPISQLEKALPSSVLARYEDRVQEESLNLADLTDLVRCPHCEFAALMDPHAKVFKCQNESCLKETCRHCKEDWKEHFGKTCEEIEKKDETTLRLQYEEKMTLAKVRVCFKCKASFTKEDGCNKMTCRCGAKMCYICRKPHIDYNHFCRHPREPGKGCKKCTMCSLWTNPNEDDDLAVAEIQKEASQKRKDKGYLDDKLIGAPTMPPAKKMKT